MNPTKRDVHGVLLLDKPSGVTSNRALQMVKRLFMAKKAGHSGSLDPIATGLLPIFFGEATKLSRYLLEADKHYSLTAELGIRTNSGDSEGEVISEREVPCFTSEDLSTVLKQFTGPLVQIPSMFSAIKHQGQPLYKLARQGVTIDRAPRDVIIHQLEKIAYNHPSLSFEVKSSKGTYMRSLVDDIGEALGCGAHVTVLRRLGAGPYAAHQMITFEKLEEILSQQGIEALDQTLISPDSSISSWPAVNLSEAAAFYLRQGQPVIVPYAPTEGLVRLQLKSGEFLGIGEILDDGRVAPRRLMVEPLACVPA